MLRFFRILFALTFAAPLFAGDTWMAIKNPPKVANGGIPLPRETSYQQKGIGVGLGIGPFFPSGNHCNTLVQWQGTLEYYYTSFLSGGFSVRMYGGDIDDKYSMIYQRYHTHLRFHFAPKSNWSLYLSQNLGFESTSLAELRENDGKAENRFGVTDEKQKEALGCDNEYSLSGFSSGLELGTGYLFAEDWAFLGGSGFEYNLSGVGQVSVILGIGFNLRNHWEFLSNHLLGSWVVLEFLAHRYFSESSGAWGEAVLLALVLNI